MSSLLDSLKRLRTKLGIVDEACTEARNRAVLEVQPPDFDEESVVLETYDLVRLVDVDGGAEYLAAPPGWLQSLLEFARLKREERAGKEARAAKRRKARTPDSTPDLLTESEP